MGLENDFNKVCKELFICLKNIDEELFNKIPMNIYRVIIDNIDSDYYFEYDVNKKLYEQNLLEGTRNFLGFLFYKYWANEEEKIRFKEVVVKNSINKKGGF